LRGVLSGEAALPRRLTARVLSALHAAGEGGVQIGPPRLMDRLTKRELEVVALLQEDLPTAVVAMRLGTSEVTVRRHISTVVHKVGASDRRGALRTLEEEQSRAA
jgi:DNA-binding NarL/FixJ family response regulator